MPLPRRRHGRCAAGTAARPPGAGTRLGGHETAKVDLLHLSGVKQLTGLALAPWNFHDGFARKQMLAKTYLAILRQLFRRTTFQTSDLGGVQCGLMGGLQSASNATGQDTRVVAAYLHNPVPRFTAHGAFA